MTEKARKEADRYLKRSLRAQKRLGYSSDVDQRVYEEALQATARAVDMLLGTQPADRSRKVAAVRPSTARS
jgi:hypothetical protein